MIYIYINYYYDIITFTERFADDCAPQAHKEVLM